jgi:flavin-binding protein dodecin
LPARTRASALQSARHRQHDPNGRNSSRTTGNKKEKAVADSVYKIVELVGTSTESWEKAATAAVSQASKSLRDLRIVEVLAQDMVVEKGKVKAFRTKVKISFKYEK